MSAAKGTKPDMGGLGDDWKRYEDLRKKADKPTPDPGGDATSRRPGITSTKRGGRRQAPAVADAVPLTVRVDPEEAIEVDQLILELRQEVGSRLTKAEVIRELLRMAHEHDPTRRTLVKRLR